MGQPSLDKKEPKQVGRSDAMTVASAKPAAVAQEGLRGLMAAVMAANSRCLASASQVLYLILPARVNVIFNDFQACLLAPAALFACASTGTFPGGSDPKRLRLTGRDAHPKIDSSNSRKGHFHRFVQ